AAVLERDRYSESIGVRNDWPTLALLLDRALADIDEAEMLALQQKWLGPESVPAPMLSPPLLWALTALLTGAVLLSGGTLVWNRLLRSQVRQRTRQLEEQIAQLEQTRQALAESEQRFRSIFNTTGDALFIHDLDTGQILDVNQTMCDMYGLTREEALRCSIEDLSSGIPPCTQKEAMMWLDRAMANGPQLFAWQARRKNGELFWVEVNMRRALIGASERIIVSARDISERLKARQAAETSNRELQALNRLLTVCAGPLNIDRLLERILDETCALTGLEGGTICFVDDDATLHLATHRNASHETVADLSTHVIRVGDCLCGNCALNGIPLILEDREQVLRYATREATRNEQIHYHAAFPLNSGRRCVGVLCLFTRTSFKPDPAHIRIIETVAPQLGIAMDNARLYRQSRAHEALLEKRVAERTAELEQANDRLKEIDRLKSMFIASMSHELRTPLNSIIGFSSILLNEWTGPLNDEQKENLDTVLRSGRHLLALINDVIDVSKIEAGLLEVETERFDLAGLLREMHDTFAGEAAEKGLELTIEPAAIELTADRRRLWQILANLVGNAIKYTERGRVEVSAGRTADGRGLRLEVRDTGIGIAQEQLSELFQPFRRLESHLTTEVPGTGLGLYLTRKMIEDIFAGSIDITSRPGAGSAFTVILPDIVAVETSKGETVS
ncbi:MAG: PAS domain S-box protein, partial [Deltaproteobacteria bacterium]